MEHKLDLAVLRANMLFRNLTDEEVLSVIDTMSPHTMKYEKRTVVARDGDEFHEIGVILSGSVHLFHIDSNGNSNLMDVLGAGDTLGELSAVGRYRLHVTVTATAQTEILFLSVDRLLRKNVLTAPTQIRFLQNLTLAVAKKGQYLTRKLEDSIRRSTRERLQDYLSAQYHKAGSRTFVIPLNRQDLADFLFVDRSAMSNELCKIAGRGPFEVRQEPLRAAGGDAHHRRRAGPQRQGIKKQPHLFGCGCFFAVQERLAARVPAASATPEAAR